MTWSRAAIEASIVARRLHAKAKQAYAGKQPLGAIYGAGYGKVSRDADAKMLRAMRAGKIPVNGSAMYAAAASTAKRNYYRMRSTSTLTAPGSKARADAHYKIEQRNTAKRQKQDRRK